MLIMEKLFFFPLYQVPSFLCFPAEQLPVAAIFPACQGWPGCQPCPLEYEPAVGLMSPPELLKMCSCVCPLNRPSLLFLRSSCPTLSYCLLLSEPAGLTPACLFTCPGVPPSFPCGETGDTDTSVLQVKDNQSTAPMHRACPSLKGISLSMLDLPLLVNQYYFFLIIFLSFWCLEMFSLRSGSIIFAGTEVKL